MTVSVGTAAHVEPGEVRLGQRGDDLPHPIRAIVEADERIAGAHWCDRLAVSHDHGGHDELVGLISLIGGANDLERIGSVRAGALDGGAIPLLRALPALVPVHPEVASAKAANDCAACRVVEQRAHVTEARTRHRVASVEQRVDGDPRNASFGTEIDESEEMLVDGVDAAIADQPHQMDRAAAFTASPRHTR